MIRKTTIVVPHNIPATPRRGASTNFNTQADAVAAENMAI
jgi:hypothetical protein